MEIRRDKRVVLSRNNYKNTKNFGTLSKNIVDIEQSKDLQERIGTFKIFSRKDTAEKPAERFYMGAGIIVCTIHQVQFHGKEGPGKIFSGLDK